MIQKFNLIWYINSNLSAFSQAFLCIYLITIRPSQNKWMGVDKQLPDTVTIVPMKQ